MVECTGTYNRRVTHYFQRTPPSLRGAFFLSTRRFFSTSGLCCPTYFLYPGPAVSMTRAAHARHRGCAADCDVDAHESPHHPLCESRCPTLHQSIALPWTQHCAGTTDQRSVIVAALLTLSSGSTTDCRLNLKFSAGIVRISANKKVLLHVGT